MYVRPPSQNRQRVKVPENYSGHAFTGNGDYSDMPPPLRQMPSKSDLPPRDLPKEDNIAFDLPKEEFSAENDETLKSEALTLISNEKNRDDPTYKGEKASLISHLLPPSGMSSHFPFGHGIGSEELLIMGAMLLVYLHGNECGEHDNDFLILLALLLFSG